MDEPKTKPKPRTKPKPYKTRKDKKVDTGKAITLKVDHNLSYSQIAAIQGVSPQAIHKDIAHLLPDQETKDFRDNRADIFAKIQLRLLKSIDDDEIKRAPIGSRVLAACQIYDKERLERGKVDQAPIQVTIQTIQARADELRNTLRALRGDNCNTIGNDNVKTNNQVVDIVE